MRLPLSLVLVFVGLTPAHAQHRDACEMATSDQLQALLGAEAVPGEETRQGTGMSLCVWKGGDDKSVRITSITAASQNIVGGTPLDYFSQHATAQKAAYPEIIHDLEGPWQAGFIWDILEDNPQEAVTITFINKDDTMTIETFGLGRDATIGFAEVVAAGM